MASEWFYGMLVLLIGVGLMYGVYHALISTESIRQTSTSLPPSQYSSSPSQTAASQPECEENSKVSCILANGCEGKKVCFQGEWTHCIAPLEKCKPGTTRACTFTREETCGSGMQTCNQCGTGWSECA